MSRPAFIVPPSTYRIYGPGQVCLDADAGDLVLVRSKGWIAAGIRFFERLRVGHDYCWTNHAAVTMNGGANAMVAQETAKGVIPTHIAQLQAETYAVIHFEMGDDQRRDVAAFAEWSIGLGYGFLSIAADAFSAVTSLELGLGTGNRMVCSTQACRAMERAGLIPDRSPYAVTPAHLAMYANVTIGDPQ